MTYKKGIGILLLISFALLPNVSLAQDSLQPETADQAKELGQKALEAGQKELPGIVEKIWKEEVLPIWQKMYDWFLANVWAKVWPYAEKEIEKRKPAVEEEFHKETEELKEEAPDLGKSIWQRFLDLIH
jgi:hypothetical protein